jgi:biopolymer transport protein ExbB
VNEIIRGRRLIFGGERNPVASPFLVGAEATGFLTFHGIELYFARAGWLATVSGFCCAAALGLGAARVILIATMRFFAGFLLMMVPIAAAHAQGTMGPPGQTRPQHPMTLDELFHAGGIMMYPLAGLSVFAVALIIFYTFSIRQNAVVSDRFMDEAETLIRKGDYLGLLQNCSRRNECIARVTQKTLDFATKNPTATFEDVREVTEAEGTRQASLLSQRVALLADIITMAPMIGLLGTVIGMISEMRTISNSVNSVQIGFASGVAEALIATAGGLMIAIPCVLAYAVFRGRVQRLVAELEAAATHLMALLSAQYKKATARAAAQRAGTAAPAPAHRHE